MHLFIGSKICNKSPCFYDLILKFLGQGTLFMCHSEQNASLSSQIDSKNKKEVKKKNKNGIYKTEIYRDLENINLTEVSP